MARIKQGILGGFSGRVSNVIGSSWKGLAVMKSRPLSVSNPRTSGQVNQRTKFAGAVAFAVAILTTIIKPLWDRFASAQSGYNAFIQANLAAFTTEGVLIPANLVTSKGKMSTTSFTPQPSGGNESIMVDWVNDAGSGLRLATDLAYCTVYNVTKDLLIGVSSSASRSEETLTIDATGLIDQGDVIATYLAFKRVDGTIVSNSVYISSIAGG